MTQRFRSTAFRGLLPVVLVCGLTVASPAHAVNTVQVGGSGGTAFTQTCPNGAVLNGLSGRAASLLDSVRAICVRMDSIGDGFSESELSSHGGSGGSSFRLRCPQGSAVTGLRGRAASLVDRIQLVCAPVLRDGTVRLAAETIDPFAVGGSGGSFFTLHCAGTRPARGIIGRAASFVDRIGLGCDTPTFVQVSPNNTTRPDFRGVTRDLPHKVRRGTSVTYETQLWNVGGVDAPAGSSMDLATNFPMSFPTILFTSQQGSCDLNDPPDIQGHFMRCRASQPTRPLVFPPLVIGVRFDAGAAPRSYAFAGLPNQDRAVTNAAQLATTHFRNMLIVDNVGRFKLTPARATVAVGERLTYKVRWTVPGTLNWKRLKSVALRITRGERTVLWARLNRASGTLSLLNRSGKRLGRSRVLGRRGKLSNRFATVHLRDSSVRGSGPTGRKVTLKLALSFKRRPATRRLRVEVLAKGPRRFEQLDVKPAGTLRVKR